MLEEAGPQSLLARAIIQGSLPGQGRATALVTDNLGALGAARNDQTLLLGEQPIYGYPHLRAVTQGDLNHAEQVFVFTRCIVDPELGSVFRFEPDESAAEAAARFTALHGAAVSEFAA